ncbi:MAG: hypothetical protein M0R06_10435, partial [Sphaerochaeta sp.]|nr:hypothetical protein [Sphaerochaeta sp.]
MIENSAAAEVQVINKIKERYDSLYKRMDADFSKYRGDSFQFGANEGTWEVITSNRAQAEAWKMINVLSMAKRKIYSMNKDLVKDDKNKAERDRLTLAENIINGLIYSYEMVNAGLTDQPLLQALMAAYRVYRGWGSYRLLVEHDDDGLPYLNLLVRDIRNTIWVPGKDRLLKDVYKRYATKEEVVDEFPGFNGTPDDKGNVLIYDVWDCAPPVDEGERKRNKRVLVKNAIIAGDEYVKEPQVVEIGGQTLDYIPTRIKAGGTMPLIHDENSDNIKLVGESSLANNRNIEDILSRLLSYKLTRAGMEAKMPQIIEYDSTGGQQPPEFDKDTYKKGSFIILDVAKKQKVGQQGLA